MQPFVCLFVAAAIISAAPAMLGQQPKIVHAQLTTEAGSQGLNAVLHGLKRQTNPQWIGYSVPVINNFSSGWNERRVTYLEGKGDSNGNSVDSNNGRTFDSTMILLRAVGAASHSSS